MDAEATAKIPRAFRTRPDPRSPNRRHKLIDILTMALFAVICGSDGWATGGESYSRLCRVALNVPKNEKSQKTCLAINRQTSRLEGVEVRLDDEEGAVGAVAEEQEDSGQGIEEVVDEGAVGEDHEIDEEDEEVEWRRGEPHAEVPREVRGDGLKAVERRDGDEVEDDREHLQHSHGGEEDLCIGVGGGAGGVDPAEGRVKGDEAGEEEKEVHEWACEGDGRVPVWRAQEVAADVGDAAWEWDSAHGEHDSGDQDAHEGVDVLEGVEGKAAALADGVIAAEVGNEAMGEFVEDDRDEPADEDGPEEGALEVDVG